MTEDKVILKYLGRDALVGAPAKDLTEAMIEASPFSKAQLLESGLYALPGAGVDDDGINISDPAKALAEENDLDLEELNVHFDNARITKPMVQEFIDQFINEGSS